MDLITVMALLVCVFLIGLPLAALYRVIRQLEGWNIELTR